jgi:hypothetical protein
VNCRVCGRQFDPTGFQILVPALKLGFDRVECALEASALGLPTERAAEPAEDPGRSLRAPAVPALAGGPGVMMAATPVLRPQVLAGANLAVLAAGTVATIYLWLRVFGPDLGAILPADDASPAFERSTVAAAFDPTPPPESRPLPESAVGGGGSQPALAPAPELVATQTGRRRVVSNRPKPQAEGPRTQGNGGPVGRPSPPPPAPAPPADPSPPRSEPVPTFPVPSSPPDDRIPGPSLPGGGSGATPQLPSLPGAGSGGGRGGSRLP